MSLWSWNLLWYVSDLFLVWWLYLGPKSVATNVKCWNGNGDRSGLCLLWIEPLFHIRFTSFFLHLIHRLKRLACFILFSTYSSVKSCFDINLDGVELASCVVQFWSTFCPKILLKTLYGWHCYVGQNPLWLNHSGETCWVLVSRRWFGTNVDTLGLFFLFYSWSQKQNSINK